MGRSPVSRGELPWGIWSDIVKREMLERASIFNHWTVMEGPSTQKISMKPLVLVWFGWWAMNWKIKLSYGLISYLWASSLLNSIVCNFYKQKWSILSFKQAIFSYWIDIDEIFWVSKRYGYKYDIDIMIPSQYWYGYDIISKFCQRFDMILISNDLGYSTPLVREMIT